MTKQEVLDLVLEHLTKLYENPDIYQDGTYNLITALEKVVIPLLKREATIERWAREAFDKDPHIFDKGYSIPSHILHRIVNRDK